mgnify:CR=1 FL=1
MSGLLSPANPGYNESSRTSVIKIVSKHEYNPRHSSETKHIFSLSTYRLWIVEHASYSATALTSRVSVPTLRDFPFQGHHPQIQDEPAWRKIYCLKFLSVSFYFLVFTGVHQTTWRVSPALEQPRCFLLRRGSWRPSNRRSRSKAPSPVAWRCPYKPRSARRVSLQAPLVGPRSGTEARRPHALSAKFRTVTSVSRNFVGSY